MSAAAEGKGWQTRLVQLLMLLATLGLAFAVQSSGTLPAGVPAAVAGLGLLLLAGTLISELAEVVGLPHLTGYLLAGILVGPHVLGLVSHDTVESLGVLNELALALIALAGGAELRIDSLRRAARSLVWAHTFQMLGIMIVVGGTFMALRGQLPFLDGMGLVPVLMVALLWSVLATTRSPSAVLGVFTQLRPKGPLTEMTLAFVMSSDVVVILLLAIALAVARLGIDPAASLDLAAFSEVGYELLGSTALGTTLGIIIASYLWVSRRGNGSSDAADALLPQAPASAAEPAAEAEDESGRNLLLLLLVLGLPMSALLKYVHLNPLLAFMVAGFAVQNFSRGGERLLHAVEKTGAIVFVVFFATAGAHLDLPGFAAIWPVALILAGVRIAVTLVAARTASRIVGDAPIIERWGWSGMVSQAGLALGVALVIVREFPEFGDGFATLAIGVVGVNEMLGPVLLKLALDRTGETGAADRQPAEADVAGDAAAGLSQPPPARSAADRDRPVPSSAPTGRTAPRPR
ncbi:MAG: cation:proton antiporter [Gammaproteobacteria bacterium]|nr:cation:proton antiporter [Gammaproteobacteria bacterium]